MTLHYQSTYEEYVEATKLLAARAAKRKRKTLAQRLFGFFLIVYFIAASQFWQWLLPHEQQIIFLQLLIPALSTAIVIGVVAALMPLLSGRLPRVSLKAFRAMLFLAFAIAMIAVLQRIQSASPVRYSQNPWTWSLLLPHTTWLAMVTMVAAFAIGSQERRRRTAWNDQPALSREKTVDITADGVIVADAVSKMEYSWNGFVGFQETKTLILLLASQSTGLYIPKRAFNGDEELNAMRALSELMPKPDAAAFLLEPTVDPSPAAPPISAWDALPPH